MAATVLEEKQRVAAVLAIGTANPANFVLQDEYPDWYFRATKSEHLAKLKAKMKKICEKSGIRKRHMHHTEEMIGSHPEFVDRALPSLAARLSVTDEVVPELAAAAAAKAIAEWGRPAKDITHLVLSTNSGAAAPAADVRVAALLGLRTTVQRTTLFFHACSAGSAALRLAKDIAEATRGARVLVASADATVVGFGGPDEARPDALVACSLFGDGAGAAIVGAGPMGAAERPIFRMVSAAQATLQGTERAVRLRVGEAGIDYNMSGELPALVRDGVERCLVDALAPLGLAGGGWNGLFWAVHPGGRAILDSYESALGLAPEKLAVSRHVLSEYGNMLGATVIFVLDELRRRRQGRDVDCEWGFMLGLGPGLSVETMVLHAADNQDKDQHT